MPLRVGLVGLPNVGKSTLFTAVTGASAVVANYPFATIDPNVGVVPIPDDRLGRIARVTGSERAIPATLEVVDIAGLVGGASRGEGLGNQFLAHIREVDAVCHLVRCFSDDDVVHVTGPGAADPLGDIGVVETELLLKDLETVERRLERSGRRARAGDRLAQKEVAALEVLREQLGAGVPARTAAGDDQARDLLGELFLLTAKPVLYAVNVGEADLPDGGPCAAVVRDHAASTGAATIVVCAQIEAELLALPPDERGEFLRSLGLEESGLERLIHAAHRLLGLVTFFTTGPKETRAWTVPAGTAAREAAGEIHTDMRRGFVRAEVIPYRDLVAHGSEAAVRDAGKMAIEGRDYPVADGDVLHVRFTPP